MYTHFLQDRTISLHKFKRYYVRIKKNKEQISEQKHQDNYRFNFKLKDSIFKNMATIIE
jgi:hypothetical protein